MQRRGSGRTVHSLDEAHARHLHQVVERLVGTLVAPSELARERQEALHELVARGQVALVVVALEKPQVLANARAVAAPPWRLRRSLFGRGPTTIRHGPNWGP